MIKRKYVLKSRLRFFTFLFLTTLIISFLVYTINISGYSEPTLKSVSIQYGDSLWSIAEQYSDDSCDIRDYIRDIKEINHLDSSLIKAGTSIVIPVME